MSVKVVTGGGSGIGRAIARRFARRGATVVVADINEQTGKETVELIRAAGGEAEFHRLDVADPADWEDFAEQVCAAYGVPDVLVNNAGILITGTFLQQSGDDWRRMLSINMMSPILGSRLFVQRMVDAGVRGHIVNVCSVGAFQPLSLTASYVVAKQGAWFGTQVLRAEFGRRGIGVSAVCPGLISTNLSANGTRSGSDAEGSATWGEKLSGLQQFFGRSPERVADAVERAVRWNLSTVPVGIEAWLGWYAHRLSPGLSRAAMGLVGMPLADWVVDNGSKVLGGKR